MTTIRDVARLAGVSSSTASLTFSKSKRVSPDTAKKVWEAAQELGYRPNPLAQSLKRGRTNLIGIVVGDLSNPFFGILLKEIERHAKRAGYNVLVAESDADPEQELSVLDHLASQRVAGTLLFPHGSGPEYVRGLKALDMPLVTIDHKIEGTNFDLVCSDNRLAASMLTEHLLRLGHRQITHMSGPAHMWTAAERIKGFRHSMAAAGISTLDIVNGGYMYEPAYASAMELLTRAEPPTAILAANNVMALGCLAALQDLGFNCPEEISLATIDNVPWSSVIKPKLTLVEQDQAKLAKTAIDYLIDRMQNAEIRNAIGRETVLTPRLSLGNSTQAPRT
ncbi:MAG: LacI family DNA-binding transcriptional regulator [Yoonia sp.]|uniref:LacI family DNA-binding transcriptional regulator n=1 Tax=Yoonia sp. TaxID=2212373 RepID=UPI003EF1010D